MVQSQNRNVPIIEQLHGEVDILREACGARNEQIADLNKQLAKCRAELNAEIKKGESITEELMEIAAERDRLRKCLVRIAKRSCVGTANDTDTLRSILLECDAALEPMP